MILIYAVLVQGGVAVGLLCRQFHEDCIHVHVLNPELLTPRGFVVLISAAVVTTEPSTCQGPAQ